MANMSTFVADSDPVDWDLKPPLLPEDCPQKYDQSAKFFEHNITFIDRLIVRDVQAGLASRGVSINETTAEQIVNLLYRSKLRRRIQIYEERVGRASPPGFEDRAQKRREEYAVTGVWLHELFSPSFNRTVDLAWSPLDELKVILQSSEDHGDHDFTGRFEDVELAEMDVVRKSAGRTCHRLSVLNALWIISPGNFPSFSDNHESKDAMSTCLQDKYALRPAMFGVAPGVIVGWRDQLHYATDSLSPRLNNHNEIRSIDNFGQRWPIVDIDNAHILTEENLRQLDTIQNLTALTRGQLRNFAEHVGPCKQNFDLFPLTAPPTPGSFDLNTTSPDGGDLSQIAPDDIIDVLNPRAKLYRSSTACTLQPTNSLSSEPIGTTAERGQRLKRLTPEVLKTTQPETPELVQQSAQTSTTASQRTYHTIPADIREQIDHANGTGGPENTAACDILNTNTDEESPESIEVRYVGIPDIPPLKQLQQFSEVSLKHRVSTYPSILFPQSLSSAGSLSCTSLGECTNNRVNTKSETHNLFTHIIRPPNPPVPSSSHQLSSQLHHFFPSDIVRAQSWIENDQESSFKPLDSPVSLLPSTPDERTPVVPNKQRLSPIYLGDGVVYPGGRRQTRPNEDSPCEQRLIRRTNMSREVHQTFTMESSRFHQDISLGQDPDTCLPRVVTPDSAKYIQPMEPMIKDTYQATFDDMKRPFLMNRNGTEAVYQHLQVQKDEGNSRLRRNVNESIRNPSTSQDPFVDTTGSSSNRPTGRRISEETRTRRNAGNATMEAHVGHGSFPSRSASPPSGKHRYYAEHGRVAYASSNLPYTQPTPLREHMFNPLDLPHWAEAYQKESSGANQPNDERGVQHTHARSSKSKQPSRSSVNHLGNPVHRHERYKAQGTYNGHHPTESPAVQPDSASHPATSRNSYEDHLVKHNRFLNEALTEVKNQAQKAEQKVLELKSKLNLMNNEIDELRYGKNEYVKSLLVRDFQLRDMDMALKQKEKLIQTITEERDNIRFDRDRYELHFHQAVQEKHIPESFLRSISFGPNATEEGTVATEQVTNATANEPVAESTATGQVTETGVIEQIAETAPLHQLLQGRNTK